MIMKDSNDIIEKVSKTVVTAGSAFREDKIHAYQKAIRMEKNETGKWIMETILENACIAEKDACPLCDDTGIPHLFIEVGKERYFSGNLFSDIQKGVSEGLKRLPGRPMAVCGSDAERIDQSRGLSRDASDVVPAPILIKQTDGNAIRVHVLMLGGGPAIRGSTYRVFHKHSVDTMIDEIVKRSVEAVRQLGCTPCTLAVGIGRSQYEAAAYMLEAQVYGNYNIQNTLEKTITERVNECKAGPLGMGGLSVLAAFLKVGPQRASGVRIVSIRPCCCFEPRIASVEL